MDLKKSIIHKKIGVDTQCGVDLDRKKAFVWRRREDTALCTQQGNKVSEPAVMSEAEDKTTSAVKELGMKVRKEEKKVEENYYVKLATNMVTTVKETRLVEDDTQDTFLKGKIWLPALFLCISRRSWCGSCFPLPWSRWSSDQVSNSQVTRRAVIVRMFGIELFWSYCSYLSLFSLFSFWKVTISRTVVGVAYPGYRSLKALLTEDKADDMLWLRYWVLSKNNRWPISPFPLGCPGGFYCA